MVDRHLHHITRLDYGKTFSWWVRIQRWKNGKLKNVNRVFSDGVHGGEAKALKAAKAWRDMLLPLHPPAKRKPSGGRRPEPVGHFIVARRQRSHKYADGSTRLSDIVYASIKVSKTKRVEFQRSVERWGQKKATQIVQQWLAEQRRTIEKKAKLKKTSTPSRRP